MVLRDQQKRNGLKGPANSSLNERKSRNVSREHSQHNTEENVSAALEPSGRKCVGVNQQKSFLPPLSCPQPVVKQSGFPGLCHSRIPVTQTFRNSWRNNSVAQLSFRKVPPRRLNPLTRPPVACLTSVSASARVLPDLSLARALTTLQSSPSSAQLPSKELHRPNKKVLLGEFTHIPAAGGIFAAKPRHLLSDASNTGHLPYLQVQPCLCHFVPICKAPPHTMETHETRCSPTVIIDSVCETDESLSGKNSPECELPPQLAAMVVRSRPPLVHTVSIVIEPVVDSMGESESDDLDDDLTPAPSSPNRDILDDDLEPKEDLVKHVMDVARLRKEEFARLLEEHAQIVHEINRAENSLIL